MSKWGADRNGQRHTLMHFEYLTMSKIEQLKELTRQHAAIAVQIAKASEEARNVNMFEIKAHVQNAAKLQCKANALQSKINMLHIEVLSHE